MLRQYAPSVVGLLGLLQLWIPALECAAIPAQNATFLMVAGAFFVSDTFDTTTGLIQAAGYDVRSAGLVTVNDPEVTIQDDITELQTTYLDPLINDQGKDIVLYCHAYAGFACSSAIQGYSKEERLSQGLTGGILGLVYQSAVIPQPGQNMIEMLGGTFPVWQTPNAQGLIDVSNSSSIFFNNVTSPPLAELAVRQLYGQSTKSFNTSSGDVYYGDSAYNNRRVYIHTANDHALPPSSQSTNIQSSNVTWKAVTLDSDHCPWLSVPTQLAPLLINTLQDLLATY